MSPQKKQLYDCMTAETYEKVRNGWDCPKCDGPMRERTRKSDGNIFFGCLRFPRCMGTRQIDAPPEVDYAEVELRIRSMEAVAPVLRGAVTGRLSKYDRTLNLADTLLKHHGDQLEDLPGDGFMPDPYDPAGPPRFLGES